MMIPEYAMTREFVRKCKLIVPENAGARWSAMSHEETLRTTEEALKNTTGKVPIVAARYWVSPNRTEMAACFDLQAGKGVASPKGYRPSLGLVTSTARRRALTLFAGFTAEDESHGLAFAELGVCKNTFQQESNLENLVEEADWYSYLEQWERLQASELSRPGQAVQMVAACRRPIKTRFHWSRLGYVDKAHDRIQKDPKRRTALTMALAFAYVLPKMKPMFQMDVMTAILYSLPRP